MRKSLLLFLSFLLIEFALIGTPFPAFGGPVPTEIERTHAERPQIERRGSRWSGWGLSTASRDSDRKGAYTDRWLMDPKESAWTFKLFSTKETSYDVPVTMNPEVERFIRYFQTSGKGFFAKWLVRSGAYMPMITGILAEEGLPKDLAYLALIESGFSPHARSHARAVGIWQFMRWTGKHNGLKIDWWIDERKDPEKATRAAARHLKHLNSRFDSWYLAAAAYNCGEGKIAKGIKRHGTDDFWVLAKKRKALKRETKEYIPKFLAAMIIAKEPAKYGFTDIVAAPPIAYDKVTLKKATDIKVIARASGTTVKEIRRLNPELLRWFTPPNYPGYEIKIPAGKTDEFTARLALIAPEDRLKFYSHKIKEGESLYAIAKRYRTSIREIAYLNDIKSTKLIRVGKLIVVPVNENTGRRMAARKIAPEPPLKDGQYIVISGDTLWDLSMRHDVSLKKIFKWNKLSKRSTLRLGQRLWLVPPVPGVKAQTVAIDKKTVPAPGIYTVRVGDTLWDISMRYDVPLNKILKWNDLKKTATLRPGQKLKLREV